MTNVEKYDKGNKHIKKFIYSGESLSSMGGIERSPSMEGSHDAKKSRREIANSNERKRMLSINTGFQQLKAQLPLSEDDRISKSAVLQQAVHHIQKLETDRNNLKQQNTRLVHRLIEVRKSMCGSSCPCKGKCCPQDTGSQSVRDRLVESELVQLVSSAASERAASQSATARTVGDLTGRLAELQTLLDRERKKSGVLENFISRIISTQSVETDTSSIDTVTVVGSQSAYNVVSHTPQTSGLKREREEETVTTADLQTLQAMTSVPCDPSQPFLESSAAASRRNNLDTIVEAIRHLEGEPASSSLVKRLRLAGSNVAADGSVKILCSDEAMGGSGEKYGSSIAMDSSQQIIYSIDDQIFLRQDDGGAPSVAAFEFVSGELVAGETPCVAAVSVEYDPQCTTTVEQSQQHTALLSL